MKNILVTGGAGFIGCHTCLALLEKGYTVFVIDSFENSSPKSLERVKELYKAKKNNLSNELKIFKGNLCDKEFLKGVFEVVKNMNKEIHGVIHFAGLKSVANSIINPLIYWRTNVLSTINLLDIMEEYNCENIIFSSSATIYEQKENFLLKEDSKIGPISPYANTKFAIEMILKDLFQSSSKCWRITSLRYFNPIGAHESGLIGEQPKGIPNNIFPLITNTALGIQKELNIYGSDWPTEDGTPVRDYIHVMDLAESHVKILEFLRGNKSTYFTLNIGTGLGTSVLNLIKTFERINNVKVRYKYANRREGDVPFLVADNSLMLSKFNLKPKRALEDMCRDGWKWKSLNPNGY
tara:strand:- start:154 stop:1206 length:1053 start_codon:yes stop_codon:yes gene_type:complete